MNKRAIELSINFIVMFILAMAVFATGVVLLRKIFSETDRMKVELDEKTRQRIEKLLTTGSSKVIVPITTKTIKSGGRDVIGVGIRNDLDATADFLVGWECDAAYDDRKQVVCDDGLQSATIPACDFCDQWLGVQPSGPYPIEPNSRSIVELFAVIPKDGVTPAIYAFHVRAYSDANRNGIADAGEQYDTTKQLNLIIT